MHNLAEMNFPTINSAELVHLLEKVTGKEMSPQYSRCRTHNTLVSKWGQDRRYQTYKVGVWMTLGDFLKFLRSSLRITDSSQEISGRNMAAEGNNELLHIDQTCETLTLITMEIALSPWKHCVVNFVSAYKAVK